MLDLEVKVFSRIKNKYPSSLKTKYPNTLFTTDDRDLSKPSFPTVFVHEISSREQGNDLENLTINAILLTIQVDVYDNAKKSNAKEVMDYVCNTMKSMGFSIINCPEFKSSDSVYRQTARFRRMVGSCDTF